MFWTIVLGVVIGGVILMALPRIFSLLCCGVIWLLDEIGINRKGMVAALLDEMSINRKGLIAAAVLWGVLIVYFALSWFLGGKI